MSLRSTQGKKAPSAKPSSQTSSAGRFQLRAKNLFLTYPKCTFPKNEALQNLLELLSPCGVVWAVVALENHEDGTPHLHCVAKLDNCVSTRKADYFDKVVGQHGNYQACRSLNDVLRYVCKDGDFVCEGITPEEIQGITEGKSSKSLEAARMLLSGASFKEIIEWDAGFVLLRLDALRKFKSLLEQLEPLKLRDWRPCVLPTKYARRTELKELVQWVNDNCDPTVKRPFKAPQLYLYGPANVGKSTFANSLMQFLDTAVAPQNEPRFFDSYVEGKTQLVVFEEFNSKQRSISWLNTFLQGGKMSLEHKGEKAFDKIANVPMIFLSNMAPEEQYRGVLPVVRQAWLSRLKVIHVTEFFDLDLCHEEEHPDFSDPPVDLDAPDFSLGQNPMIAHKEDCLCRSCRPTPAAVAAFNQVVSEEDFCDLQFDLEDLDGMVEVPLLGEPDCQVRTLSQATTLTDSPSSDSEDSDAEVVYCFHLRPKGTCRYCNGSCSGSDMDCDE